MLLTRGKSKIQRERKIANDGKRYTDIQKKDDIAILILWKVDSEQEV